MRFGTLSSIVVLTTLSACSTTASAPPPADPIVYDASAKTRSETEIARWGYETDTGGTSIFHGYDANNELIVELRHAFAISGRFTRRFVLTMTGPEVSGSVDIAYESVWRDDIGRSQYVARVLQNSIALGGLERRILDRVAPDAKTIPANAAASLAKGDIEHASVKPLDTSLVDDEIACLCQLTNNGAAGAAATATECSLVGASSAPDVQAIGLLDPLDVPGGFKQDLVVGDGGELRVENDWDPETSYNTVDSNCHSAASAEIDANTGYVACEDTSDTTRYYGHTASWTFDPRTQKKNAFCIYEPQYSGFTLVTPEAGCCWEGPIGANGAPDLTQEPAASCANKMCRGQPDPPRAMPTGEKPLVPIDCPATSTTLDACNGCCTAQADEVEAAAIENTWGPSSLIDIIDYRKSCSQTCSDRHLLRPAPKPTPSLKGSNVPALRPTTIFDAPVDATATRCLGIGLGANSALAAASAARHL